MITGLPMVMARKCRMSDLSRHGNVLPLPITPFSDIGGDEEDINFIWKSDIQIRFSRVGKIEIEFFRASPLAFTQPAGRKAAFFTL